MQKNHLKLINNILSFITNEDINTKKDRSFTFSSESEPKLEPKLEPKSEPHAQMPQRNKKDTKTQKGG